MRSKFASISSKTDAFCQRYLNDEYRQLVRTPVAALCRKRPSPLLRWAAGFIRGGCELSTGRRLPETACAAHRIFSLTPNRARRAIRMSLRDLLPKPLIPLFSTIGFYRAARTPAARSLGDNLTLEHRKETMKIRLLLALAGFAIGFVLPTFAQQKDTVDPRIIQQRDLLAIPDALAVFGALSGKL